MHYTMLSVIIPAYNEEKTIKLILKKIVDVNLNGLKKEIIIINDCSKDKTLEKIQEFKNENPNELIIVYNQDKNQGKGAAIRKGIELATGEYVIIQDADLECDPEEYPNLLKPILEGFADVVYGSRFVGGKARRIFSFWHKLGNQFITLVSNLFTNLSLTDVSTCYKLFRSEIIKKISIEENRFAVDVEITAKIAKIKSIKIYEVGIAYYGRTLEEGKKIKWRDGFSVLWCIIKYNLFR